MMGLDNDTRGWIMAAVSGVGKDSSIFLHSQHQLNNYQLVHLEVWYAHV